MALSTALKNALDLACHGVGAAEELATALDNATSVLGAATAADLTKLHAVTSTAAELNASAGVTAGIVSANSSVVAGALKQVDTLAVASLVAGVSSTPGAAGQAITTIVKKTAIADNTATSVFRVTCPNAEHAAILEITFLATVKKTAGATLESSRVAVGYVVFDRTTGAALVGTAATLSNTAIATSGTDTLTFAYSLTAASGAVGVANTMDVQVTLVGSGTDTHQIVALATIINSEASGMTVAAV